MLKPAALAWLMAAVLLAPAGVGAAEKPKLGKTQTGDASFYSKRLAGKKTASGEHFDPQKLTAASKTLPLGTKAKVTSTETGKSVQVTVTDRGPFAQGRIIDVSPKAAETLGMKEDGVVEVKVKPVALPEPARDGPPRNDGPAKN